MARIHWTDEERDILILRMAEILVEDDTINKIKLWSKSQDILPVERRRKAMAFTGKDKKIMDKAFAEAKKTRLLGKPAEATEPEPSPPLVVEAQPQPEPQVVTERIYVEKDVSTVPLNVLLGELIGRLLVSYMPTLGAVAEQVMKETPIPEIQRAKTETQAAPYQPAVVAQQHEPQLPPLPKNNPSGGKFTPRITNGRNPRVAVVGLLKDQFNHLENRINRSKVDLLWVDKDKHQELPNIADLVIVQRHSGRQYLGIARAKYGSDRVVYVDGGITACQEAITQEYGNCLN